MLYCYEFPNFPPARLWVRVNLTPFLSRSVTCKNGAARLHVSLRKVLIFTLLLKGIGKTPE